MKFENGEARKCCISLLWRLVCSLFLARQMWTLDKENFRWSEWNYFFCWLADPNILQIANKRDEVELMRRKWSTIKTTWAHTKYLCKSMKHFSRPFVFLSWAQHPNSRNKRLQKNRAANTHAYETAHVYWSRTHSRNTALCSKKIVPPHSVFCVVKEASWKKD